MRPLRLLLVWVKKKKSQKEEKPVVQAKQNCRPPPLLSNSLAQGLDWPGTDIGISDNVETVTMLDYQFQS